MLGFGSDLQPTGAAGPRRSQAGPRGLWMPPAGAPGPSLPATPSPQLCPHPRAAGSPFSPHSYRGQKAPKINSGHLLAAPASWGRGLGQADPRPAPPGLRCAVTRVSGKCRRVRAGRPGCPHQGTRTRDARSRSEDRPISAHPHPSLPHRTFPAAQSSFGGWGALPPGAQRDPAPLRSPPRGARRRRSPSGGRRGAAQRRRRPRRRGPLSIFPLGRPGRRVRGAVGTFATLLAFHSRHVTPRRPRHSTPLPAHSSGGRGFQGGKGREGPARPPGPRWRGRLPSLRPADPRRARPSVYLQVVRSDTSSPHKTHGAPQQLLAGFWRERGTASTC